jgi:hypothetical protein
MVVVKRTYRLARCYDGHGVELLVNPSDPPARGAADVAMYIHACVFVYVCGHRAQGLVGVSSRDVETNQIGENESKPIPRDRSSYLSYAPAASRAACCASDSSPPPSAPSRPTAAWCK